MAESDPYEAERAAVYDAISSYGSARQEFGQTWKAFGKGGEPNDRARAKIQPARDETDRVTQLLIDAAEARGDNNPSTPGGYITTKAHYAEVKKARGDILPMPTEEAIIRGLVDMLIARLYDPHREIGWRASPRIEEAGLHHDAINWGDLGCCDVTLKDGVYYVLIEEVAPDAANLQSYIAGWLTAWGWPVEVATEW